MASHRPRFIADKLSSDESCYLSPQQERHLTRSLRREIGCEVEVFIKELELAFSGIYVGKALVQIQEKLSQTQKKNIHFLLGCPKSKSLESTTEKLAELGIAQLTVFHADHSPVNLFKDTAKLVSRLSRIAESAWELSCSNVGMKIDTASSFEKALKSAINSKETDCLKLIPLAPHERITEVAEIASFLSNQGTDSTKGFEKPAKFDDVIIVIGPEGGFSDREISIAKELGFRGVSLGENILRVETAAVVMAGISQILL